jgi:predicted O-methyltransferase YrrM
MTRKFSADWFTNKTSAWCEHVVPRFKNLPNVHWLEIGTYEGKSATWILDNVLQGPNAKIYCLDPFDSNFPYLGCWAPNIHYEEVFDANVTGDDRVVKLKGLSQDILPTLKDERFHGAYIDGEHNEKCILFEADAVWKLLLPGGILVFDDYGYVEQPEAKVAIDRFLSRPEIRHEVLFLGFQAMILKLD